MEWIYSRGRRFRYHVEAGVLQELVGGSYRPVDRYGRVR
jgi:hypothetical protein